MSPTPEDKARAQIDKMLTQAGWHVCDFKDANIHAARGVVIRNYPLNKGHGFADYLFYIDGKAAGVIEAKKVGTTLTGVEIQQDRPDRPRLHLDDPKALFDPQGRRDQRGA
jgi:type I restriction enzyme R subunit